MKKAPIGLLAQVAAKSPKKTVALPGGEVIPDMSGNWNAVTEFYGEFFSIPSPPTDTVIITQGGHKFTGVWQNGNEYIPAGTQILKGELDKNGFKSVYQLVAAKDLDGPPDWEPSNWEIVGNGNVMKLETGERLRMLLIRELI